MIFPLWDRITQMKIDLLCFRLRRGLGSHWVLQSKRNFVLFNRGARGDASLDAKDAEAAKPIIAGRG